MSQPSWGADRPLGAGPTRPPQVPWQLPGFGVHAPEPTRRRSRLTWLIPLVIIVVVAAVVTTLLVVNRDPGVRDSGRTITNAESFASGVEQTWSSTLPKQGITKGADAGCFYLADEKSEEVTGKLACGPVRRAKTSADRLWDIYAYTVEQGAKKDTARATQPDEDAQQATALPAGTILINPDGSVASPETSGLAEPPIPAAAENAVWTSDQFTVADADKGESVPTSSALSLSGLGQRYAIDSLVGYQAATIDDAIAEPAKGQRLWVLTLSSSQATNGFEGPNTLTLTIGDQQESIDEPTKAPLTFLISAPTDGPLDLVLDADGRKQTLNLMTGERAGEAGTDVLYTDGAAKTISPGVLLALPRATDASGNYYDVIVSVDSVSVSAYQNGWADAGQQFVSLTLSSSGTTNAPGTLYYLLDCATTTISEGKATCEHDPDGTMKVTGTVAVGSSLTLNFGGSMHTTTSVTGGSETTVPLSPASATVPLPT